MRKQIIFAIFSLATLSIHADEGMWVLTDLKAQNAVAMRELGLEIPIEEVYNANSIPLKVAAYTSVVDAPEKSFLPKVWYSLTIIAVMEPFSSTVT